MKKLLFLLLLFPLLASAQYTPKKLYGAYNFIVCDSVGACDTIKIYPQNSIKVGSPLSAGAGVCHESSTEIFHNEIVLKKCYSDSSWNYTTYLSADTLDNGGFEYYFNAYISASGNILDIDGLRYRTSNSTIADDSTVFIHQQNFGGLNGEVYAYSATNETIDAWAEFIINYDGSIILKSNSAGNVSTSDVDGDLCIIDMGTYNVVKNRLSAKRRI